MRFFYIAICLILHVMSVAYGKRFPREESQMSTYLAQADFAVNLLKQVEKEGESTIFSPFSIAVALAMTLAGAEGETKQQMNAVLAKGSNDEELHKLLASLSKEMKGNQNGFELNSANRIYLNNNFTPKKTYTDFINSYYNGEFKVSDFSAVKALVQEVNGWVMNQTNSKIQDLITEDAIDPSTVMVLLNAVYFKGDWAKKFDEKRTEKKQFRQTENMKRTVDMMQMKSKFNYMEDDDVQVLGLPYKDSDLSMYIFLPKEVYGLSKVINKMNGEWLLDHIKSCHSQEVEVEMPKFKLEAKMGLVETLKNLGMVDAFSSKANFSGISDGPLLISDAIHKAFIEVNEEGTEAAAATGIIMSRAMIIPRVVKFHADHPFMFVIALGDAVIFMGTYI